MMDTAPSPAPSPLQPGDCFAAHRIERYLGAGDSAEVYAARTPTGERRALKIMRAPAGVASQQRARFAQEGEALALVVHPNVLRFYDAGVQDERVWLSLELIEGETLGQRLRSSGRPPLDDLLHWIQQACDGLAEAHRVGVVHRDLTPDNILITPGGSVKVIDFGLAGLRQWGVATRPEQRIGSARYMSPEQATGAPATPSMDVYGMGHILYEAIAGVHAMGPEPRSVPRIVAWQLSGRPRPLRELAPEVPADLEALVHRMLEKDPAARPASMSAINSRLRDVLTRRRARQRRAARNVPRSDRAAVLAPTMPMPVTTEEPPKPPPMPAAAAAAEALTTEEPPKPPPMPAAAPAPETGTAELQSTEPRSTDVPIETPARPSRVAPRRWAHAAPIVAGVITLAATTVDFVFGPALGALWETVVKSRPAASGAPPASATSARAEAPLATASATAPPAPAIAPPASAAPPSPDRAARVPKPRASAEPWNPRRSPGATPRSPAGPPADPPRAKNRLFDTEP